MDPLYTPTKKIAIVPTTDGEVKVKVLDTFTGSAGRELATVRTLDGSAAFSQWSHGGWCESDTAKYPLDLVHMVASDPAVS